MTKVFVSQDEITVDPKGWNEKRENSVLIHFYEEKREEEITFIELARLAQEGGSFTFLYDSREDIYSIRDGESVE